jgi:molybdate transport system permease protein
MFAYIINKKNIPLKHIWETILILPLVLPPSVMGYLLLLFIGRRGPLGILCENIFGSTLVFTWVAATMASCIVSLPLMYQNVKAAMISIDPLYERAARTLGATETRIFRTILLPLSTPGIVSGTALAFARALGEFGATMMVAGNIPGKTQTIPIAVYYAVEGGNTSLANRLVLVMTIFSFLLIFVLNGWLKKKNYNGVN